MSGTSCDGVDAVVAELSGDYGVEPGAPSEGRSAGSACLTAHVLEHHHVSFEAAFQQQLLRLDRAPAADLALAHVELGERFATAAQTAMRRAGLDSGQVTAVASAGLTVAHIPPGLAGPGATLSLGDGDVIAERTGCTVVSDFRARDRAAGGQGAPLVPFAEVCLLRRPDRVMGSLNLGGIANVTIVHPQAPPQAFDTGPANMLIDGALLRASAGELSFDEGGCLGLVGEVDRTWLAQALAADEFLAEPPPRSTGRERYGAAFLDRHWPALNRLATPDLAATLAAYTVESVGRALDDFVPERPSQLIVSGGGALNACLMQGLQARLAPTEVMDSVEVLGVPVFAREALAFAILADATLLGVPCNVPSVTGARRAVRLGKLSFPG